MFFNHSTHSFTRVVCVDMILDFEGVVASLAVIITFLQGAAAEKEGNAEGEER